MKQYLALFLMMTPSDVFSSQMKRYGEPIECHTFQSRLKRESISYSDIQDALAIDFSPEARRFRDELHAQTTSILVNKSLIISPEDKVALKQLLVACDYLLVKNNEHAVELLKEAAIHVDVAKIFLAYCYQYGIGVEKNESSAKLLLDLGCEADERGTVETTLKNLYYNIKLGL